MPAERRLYAGASLSPRTIPVLVKPSKLFYDRIGDEVTNELVTWFNELDMAYRSELRAISDASFNRFEDRLERRLAEFAATLDQRIAARFAALGIEARFERGDSRMSSIETRMTSLETRMTSLETRMTSLETALASLETKVTALEARMFAVETRLRVVESTLERKADRADVMKVRSDLIAWSFVFWVSTVGAVALLRVLP